MSRLPRPRSLSLALAVSLFACASLARAEPPDEFRSPYRLHLYIDVPVTVAALTLWLVPQYAVGTNVAGSWCGTSTTAPCDPSQLNVIDRQVIGTIYPDARPVADAFFALPALFAAVEVFDVGITRWRSWLTDSLIAVEAVSLNGAADEIVRRAFRRPRPYLYIPGAYPDDRNRPDASFSFYSGHTSAMFALAVSLSYTYSLRHPASKSQYAVWAGLLAMASVEPVLRVLSGDHFPTDVATGALLGSALGALIPAIHRRADFIPGVKLVSLYSSMRPEGGAVLSLGGRF